MKFKLGDKVNTPKGVGVITDVYPGHDLTYEVDYENRGFCRYPESLLTLFKKDLTNLEVGDVVEDEDGKQMILGVCGRVYMMSLADDFERCSVGGWTAKELERHGYKLVSESPEDTINLLGKTYKKSDIENALKGIEEV